MDDMGARLAEILNDPESMEKVRAMAESFLNTEDGNSKEQSEHATSPTFNLPPEINPADLTKIMGILSKLRAGGEDDRTRLLLALKPHLSEKRQRKTETAIKLLKLIEVLPLLKNSGLLNI